MKNWRRILVTGMIAGMVAITGCSSNIPETNQGNRNGQRVVDAVNRRTDSYGLTRARNTNARTTRGFNRGIRRAARNNGPIGTRHYNNYHRGLGTGTTRNTPNRSAGTHYRGRVGHTFGYGQHGYSNFYDSEYGGYDLGQRADTNMHRNVTPSTSQSPSTQRRNSANLNNRVVRSTPAGNTTTHRSTANTTTGTTRKSGVTGTGVTRSTTPKAVQPTRKATPAKTVQSVRSTQSTATPSPSPSRSTQPMQHNTVKPVAPARPQVNRQTTRNISARAESARNLHQNTRPMHVNEDFHPWLTNTSVSEDFHPWLTPNANRVTSPSANRGITRARSAQNNQNRRTRRANVRRSANDMARRPISTNRSSSNRRLGQRINVSPSYTNNNDAYNMYGENFNANTYGINNNHGIYDGSHVAYGTHDGINDHYVHGSPAFAGFHGSADGINHVVPVSTSDDHTDYAFFKRNRNNNDETPATPVPASPQSPDRMDRANPVPVPAPAPVPANPAPSSWNNNTSENIHDLDDAIDNIHDNNGNTNQVPLPINANPNPTSPAPRTGQQRLMK